MKTYMNENSLVLCPEGRIDSANAEAVSAEINEIRGKEAHQALVLDFENLAYISSAGLRMVLRLKKAEKAVSIINASSEVYEILEMTGFTEMLPVSKAYRKLSMEGCEVIGAGSNGVVYRYTDDIVVKVYRNNDALADIHRERELARTALVLGVNTAIPYDVVQVGDKYGSVFELLSAKSLSKLIIEDPENVGRYVDIFADMLRDIHRTEVPAGTLPAIKQVYLGYAEFLKGTLDDARYEKLHAMIEALPDSNHMIHGDYHTNNVHYSNGEAILIDMDTLACGAPVFEFASVWLAYKGFNSMDPSSSMKFLKIGPPMTDVIYDTLLSDYFGCPAAELAAYQDRIELLGTVRLLRRTIRREADNTDGIAMLKARLETLLDRTDSLDLPEAKQ